MVELIIRLNGLIVEPRTNSTLAKNSIRNILLTKIEKKKNTK